MVKGMITTATQHDAVARAESVRLSSAATRGSGRGATATRAAATALESAWVLFPRPMIGERISVPWAAINDGGNIRVVPEPSYRLLVVDDEPLALNLAKRVFESESDIALHSATSAVRALEMAMIHDIDLVITDQRMPEMTGLQFLARVREVRPRALRVLLTAFPDTTVALKAINEGLLYRFILKPWEPEDMRVTVRRALETKRLADEHDRLVNQLKTSYEELIQSEHMAALGRLSAGIGPEVKTSVDPLVARLAPLAPAAGIRAPGAEAGSGPTGPVPRSRDHAGGAQPARKRGRRSAARPRAADRGAHVARGLHRPPGSRRQWHGPRPRSGAAALQTLHPDQHGDERPRARPEHLQEHRGEPRRPARGGRGRSTRHAHHRDAARDRGSLSIPGARPARISSARRRTAGAISGCVRT